MKRARAHGARESLYGPGIGGPVTQDPAHVHGLAGLPAPRRPRSEKTKESEIPQQNSCSVLLFLTEPLQKKEGI
ncbi:hypothetical protein EYF80_010787 [Liparis tanakae]|uniref:Uncharacterized protein n=1 Tax=Liparis tanakae TaxID=230148 RepID=A0A4Z2IN20_9TELE|nr:hypothetical protein EYF80_010787 [Liparis tanakae]